MITREAMIDKMRQVGRNVLPAGSALWLYGSRARGDHRADSDWDLLIILNKKELESVDYSLGYPFQVMGFDLNEYISPQVYSRGEWEAQSFLPFNKNVEHDKIVLL